MTAGTCFVCSRCMKEDFLRKTCSAFVQMLFEVTNRFHCSFPVVVSDFPEHSSFANNVITPVLTPLKGNYTF